MGVTTALLTRFLTSTASSVPFLCNPLCTYPIAMFFPSVGDGMPEVIVPAPRHRMSTHPREYSRGLTDLLLRRRVDDLRALYKFAMRHMCRSVNEGEQDVRLAGAPSTTSPTRLFGGPSFRCASTPSAPIKPPVSRRALPEAPPRLRSVHEYCQKGGRTNNPREPGFDWGRVLVEVLAVETHARLEAQAVAGAEPGELHRRF